MKIVYVSSEMMERVCHPLTVEYWNSDYDPITDYEKHNKALLESALASPRQTYGGKELYPDLASKAAFLFYTLNKNHPFLNGNKRIAAMTLLVFLALNRKWLEVGSEDFVSITLKVANSVPKDREALLEEIKKWISEHLVLMKTGK